MHFYLSDEKYDFDNPDWDIHVLTGSLKLFFRELMEPLFPYKQFEMFLSAISKLSYLPQHSSISIKQVSVNSMAGLFSGAIKASFTSAFTSFSNKNTALEAGIFLMYKPKGYTLITRLLTGSIVMEVTSITHCTRDSNTAF